MSESKTFIVMFNNAAAYEKYKQEVIQSGGEITNDYGSLLGFSARMPPSVVELIRSGSLVDNGISSFEPDSVVTIQ